jgi:hypothetical protein
MYRNDNVSLSFSDEDYCGPHSFFYRYYDSKGETDIAFESAVQLVGN